eukprot:gene26200-11930_t
MGCLSSKEASSNELEATSKVSFNGPDSEAKSKSNFENELEKWLIRPQARGKNLSSFVSGSKRGVNRAQYKMVVEVPVDLPVVEGGQRQKSLKKSKSGSKNEVVKVPVVLPVVDTHVWPAKEYENSIKVYPSQARFPHAVSSSDIYAPPVQLAFSHMSDGDGYLLLALFDGVGGPHASRFFADEVQQVFASTLRSLRGSKDTTEAEGGGVGDSSGRAPMFTKALKLTLSKLDVAFAATAVGANKGKGACGTSCAIAVIDTAGEQLVIGVVGSCSIFVGRSVGSFNAATAEAEVLADGRRHRAAVEALCTIAASGPPPRAAVETLRAVATSGAPPAADTICCVLGFPNLNMQRPVMDDLCQEPVTDESCQVEWDMIIQWTKYRAAKSKRLVNLFKDTMYAARKAVKLESRNKELAAWKYLGRAKRTDGGKDNLTPPGSNTLAMTDSSCEVTPYKPSASAAATVTPARRSGIPRAGDSKAGRPRSTSNTPPSGLRPRHSNTGTSSGPGAGSGSGAKGAGTGTSSGDSSGEEEPALRGPRGAQPPLASAPRQPSGATARSGSNPSQSPSLIPTRSTNPSPSTRRAPSQTPSPSAVYDLRRRNGSKEAEPLPTQPSTSARKNSAFDMRRRSKGQAADASGTSVGLGASGSKGAEASGTNVGPEASGTSVGLEASVSKGAEASGTIVGPEASGGKEAEASSSAEAENSTGLGIEVSISKEVEASTSLGSGAFKSMGTREDSASPQLAFAGFHPDSTLPLNPGSLALGCAPPAQAGTRDEVATEPVLDPSRDKESNPLGLSNEVGGEGGSSEMRMVRNMKFDSGGLDTSTPKSPAESPMLTQSSPNSPTPATMSPRPNSSPSSGSKIPPLYPTDSPVLAKSPLNSPTPATMHSPPSSTTTPLPPMLAKSSLNSPTHSAMHPPPSPTTAPLPPMLAKSSLNSPTHSAMHSPPSPTTAPLPPMLAKSSLNSPTHSAQSPRPTTSPCSASKIPDAPPLQAHFCLSPGGSSQIPSAPVVGQDMVE